MRIAKAILCPQCGRECSALVLIRSAGLGDEACSGLGYCSDLCLTIHLKHSFDPKQRPTTNLLADTSRGPLISLDECNSRQQAEMVGLFNFLRAIAQTEVIQSTIADNNRLARFHVLQNADEVKGLSDLAFAIDSVKMALRLPIDPARAEFIIRRLHEIIEDAKDRLIAEDGDLIFDQAERVEREIVHAIVKNTIETIIELGSEPPQYQYPSKHFNNKMAEEAIFDLSSGSEPDQTMDVCNPACVLFQDIEDEVLQTVSITISENGGGQHRFRVQMNRYDNAGPALERLADVIKAEELYSAADFIIVERKLDVDEYDIDSYMSCLRVVPMHERVKNLMEHKLHISRNLSFKSVYRPETHIVLHLHFRKEAFVHELNFFANIEKSEQLTLFEQQVSAHLCRLFLPPGCPPALTLKIVRGKEKFDCLNNLFTGRQKETKIISIEVSGTDVMFDHQYEEQIYTKSELDFFQSFKNEVRSERFVQALAFCAGVDIADAKQHLEFLLTDKELDKRPVGQAELLRVYRCLRISRILESGHDLLKMHPLSFVLGLRLGEPKKTFPIFRALGRPAPAPLTMRFFEHSVQPSEGHCLMQLLATDKLPHILCIRYEAGSRGMELFTLLTKPEIEINSKISYELKAVLQTEFDPRGYCTSVTLCGDSITNKSAFLRMKGQLLENKPPKTLVLVLELKTAWIRLEQFSTS